MSIYDFLYLIPCSLIAITFHEVAHGWVSYKLGDNTAKKAGRLTLNPLAHLDPFGILCMVLFKIGWAKPVPINPYYYKNKKLGTALVAIAGPVSNILLGTVSIFIMTYMESLATLGKLNVSNVTQTVYMVLYYFSVLNINLAVFNLIPINPLDGSRILAVILPESITEWISRYERYTMFILMFVIYIGILNKPLAYIYNLVEGGIYYIAQSIIF